MVENRVLDLPKPVRHNLTERLNGGAEGIIPDPFAAAPAPQNEAPAVTYIRPVVKAAEETSHLAARVPTQLLERMHAAHHVCAAHHLLNTGTKYTFAAFVADAMEAAITKTEVTRGVKIA